MTAQLAVAPLLVVLSTAILTLFVGRYRRVTIGISLVGGIGYAAVVALLFQRVATEGPISYQLSGWPAPFGITILADGLSTFMLMLAAIVGLAALVFSVVYMGEFGQRLSYHSLFHFMLVGVTGAFLTGDIFNLFVWFEVMLMASYVLVVFYSGPSQTQAAMQYVVLNLIGSAVMLLAIGGLYATTGTLNMADLARRLGDPGAYNVAMTPVLGLSALLFIVFALKAGIVPFHFWVPAAYRAAPAPVAAVLAGVVKKVGIYAIIRLYFTVFDAASVQVTSFGLVDDTLLAFYGPILLVSAVASILLGGVMAINREDLDTLLAYSSIGQVGFIVLPLAVGASIDDPELRLLAIAAALVYTLNHAVAKGLLFLISGAVFDAVGSTQFSDLGGLSERSFGLSVGFFLAGLSLIGIPPLVGFFGKLFVFDVASRAGSALAVGVALVGAILTIIYLSQAWNRAFWGPPATDVLGLDRRQVSVILVLALMIPVLGIGFDPVYRAAEAAAMAALDRSSYIETVLGGPS